MSGLLRSIYRSLPLVRDIRQIRDTLSQMDRRQQQLLLSQLEEYTHRLLKDERYCSPKRLNRYELQVFSEGGEDGILSEIFRRIGVTSRTLVEIGAGDGLQNSTAFLVFQNWRAFWVEGDGGAVETIHRLLRTPIAEGRLTVAQSFVTAENIADTLRQMEVPEEVDLLSLDIDRNTYWVWAALPKLRARVVAVEYNATIPPDVDWKVEYRAERGWNGTAYFGASLKAYELLGRRHGYSLVGCSLNGVNAFFVRQDLCQDHFEQPFTSEHHYEPPRFFLGRRRSHPACFHDEPSES